MQFSEALKNEKTPNIKLLLSLFCMAFFLHINLSFCLSLCPPPVLLLSVLSSCCSISYLTYLLQPVSLSNPHICLSISPFSCIFNLFNLFISLSQPNHHLWLTFISFWNGLVASCLFAEGFLFPLFFFPHQYLHTQRRLDKSSHSVVCLQLLIKKLVVYTVMESGDGVTVT